MAQHAADDYWIRYLTESARALESFKEYTTERTRAGLAKHLRAKTLEEHSRINGEVEAWGSIAALVCSHKNEEVEHEMALEQQRQRQGGG